jgi:putative endonuclease
MAEHNTIGKIGENIAVKYLKTKEFTIVDRNFHVKRGEIDIVATKLHVKYKNIAFIEVKTKKVNDFKKINDLAFSPENNLSKQKKERMKRAISYYFALNKIKESDYDIKVIALIVFLNTDTKQAKIRMYEDFIL